MKLFIPLLRIQLLLFVVMGLLALLTFASVAHAQSCTTLFPSGEAAPGGYGASWNPFSNARELLLTGTCNGDTVAVTIGSDQPNQYVFNQSFHWNGTEWRQIQLQGSNPAVGNWIPRQGKGSFNKGNQNPAIFVGYVCQYAENTWKCGCVDQTCSAPHWQVQALQTQTGGGGGGGTPTGELEDPPPMTQNPLIVENVCPEDARWPSSNQMAGRDVKITLPKDRVCKKEAHLGGTSDNPAHNIWVSGGVIDFKSTAIQNGGGITLIEWDGTAFFEGLHIDINNSCADGIRSYNPRSGRVVIQNSYIHGAAYCFPEGTHGDFYHAQGSNNRTGTNVRELVLQNVRADLIKQGLFVPLRSNGHGVRKMTLDHVELRLDAEFKDPRDSIATMVFADPTGGGGNQYPPDGQHYNEVYLNWWDPHYPNTKGRKNAVLPQASSFDSNGCSVYSADIISAAKLSGKWCAGSPPSGTFVPLDKIGLNYDRSYFTK